MAKKTNMRLSSLLYNHVNDKLMAIVDSSLIGSPYNSLLWTRPLGLKFGPIVWHTSAITTELQEVCFGQHSFPPPENRRPTAH